MGKIVIVGFALIVLALMFPTINGWVGDTTSTVTDNITDNITATYPYSGGTVPAFNNVHGYLLHYIWWLIAIGIIVVLIYFWRKRSGS